MKIVKRIRQSIKQIVIGWVIEDIRNAGELRRVIKQLSDDACRPTDRLDTLTVKGIRYQPDAEGIRIRSALMRR